MLLRNKVMNVIGHIVRYALIIGAIVLVIGIYDMNVKNAEAEKYEHEYNLKKAAYTSGYENGYEDGERFADYNDEYNGG